MKLYKIILFFLGFNDVYSQPLCNNGDYYCSSLKKCLTKGVICKNDCEVCLDKQKNGEKIACINDCNNEVNHLTHTDCLDYTRCDVGYVIIKSNNVCSCKKTNKICDYKFVCPDMKEINLKDKLKDYSTYEISLELKDGYENGNIYAMYGDTHNPMRLPPSYQIENLGVNVGGTNPIMNHIVPEGKYDSWLTIGIHNSEILGKISSIGIDFDDWTDDNGITVTNGAVFLLDPTIKLSNTKKYIMGHLTLKDSEEYNMIINVQGLQDTRLVLNSATFVETNILYNFKTNDKNINGH
jgi:hypothetical protein